MILLIIFIFFIQEFHEKQIQTKSTDIPTTDHPRTQKMTDDTTE